MIKDDTRQTIKFVTWVVIIVVLLYFAFVALFYQAGQPGRSETQNVKQIATSKTPITLVEAHYHLDRGINSYAVKGISKKNGTYYFIYLPGSKKGYLYPAKKGVNETTIRAEFNQKHTGGKINEVNLGWYQNKPVWEVTAKNAAGDYSYKLYEFKTGKFIG
ncbi:hypothetical protein PT281_01715 [Lactobacillus sp. ESL0701]|uniref:hypothetical protein n=1 Tax=Lactobacillus sp. ESL0701 TaxID=2983217 RepID=UPI0023F9552F|nr:hypothetical protein [Lactobacillus sp. ESL0701]MDF7672004.1 hypothetical protein [Lactobacillus sp. ESL0701]